MKPLNPVRAVTVALSETIAGQGQLLDTLAKAVQGPLGSAVRATGPVGQTVKDFLHGVWLGHALHPALTDVPIGAWTAGVLFDVPPAAIRACFSKIGSSAEPLNAWIYWYWARRPSDIRVFSLRYHTPSTIGL